MKKYDCFYFFNELDLLEIRLNILDDHVDYFVIIEATTTFSGDNKKLFFKNNKDRFKKWRHKIIHGIVEDINTPPDILKKAFESPNTIDDNDIWLREFCQKESLGLFIDDLKDEDVVFVSDVDEIWDPSCIPEIVKDGVVYRPLQKAYPFRINASTNQPYSDWTGTRFSTFETFKLYGANHFRTEREVSGYKIKNGGWHYSWMGNSSDKVKSWSGFPDINSRLFAASIYPEEVEIENIPTFLRKNRKRYKKLFLPEVFNKEIPKICFKYFNKIFKVNYICFKYFVHRVFYILKNKNDRKKIYHLSLRPKK